MTAIIYINIMACGSCTGFGMFVIISKICICNLFKLFNMLIAMHGGTTKIIIREGEKNLIAPIGK